MARKLGMLPCHPLFSIKDGNFFMELVQPKVTWARSLQVKVKVEMDALANVPPVTKRGGWAEIKAF